MKIKRGLTFIVEVDPKFTVGVEFLPPYIFGIRLGFVAFHLVTLTLDSFIETSYPCVKED